MSDADEVFIFWTDDGERVTCSLADVKARALEDRFPVIDGDA